MKALFHRLREKLSAIDWKEKLKKFLRFIANPRLLICWLIAWLITNGWSYIMFGLGTYYEVEWMVAVAGAYLAFLWLPISPEKLVTCVIALALLRWLFPSDQKTLAVLREWYEKTKAALRARKARKAEEKAREQEDQTAGE